MKYRSNEDLSVSQCAEITQIEFRGWRPASLGKGKSTEVHMIVTLASSDVPLLMKFTEVDQLNLMIKHLTRQRDSVWPGN